MTRYLLPHNETSPITLDSPSYLIFVFVIDFCTKNRYIVRALVGPWILAPKGFVSLIILD
jgi:hypothetical protein